MKSLFDFETHQEVLKRIDTLDENRVALWGKMSVAEMLNHSQRPLLVANGRLAFTEKLNPLKRLVFKFYKSQMYNDKPWKHDIHTVKDFVVSGADPFVEEKERLIVCINEFQKKDLNLHWPKHPFFGSFSTAQWGMMQYKHIDHHLRQFGV